ncbi:MAG: MFS transporter [Undibacterium sp.]|nr:MFS transporter [Undibacterium sp.]
MHSTSQGIDRSVELLFDREDRQKKIRRAMLFGGFSSFSMLYCVQPLMPLLADSFQLSATQTSWVLSISTLCLALSLVVCSLISEVIGRKPMMIWAVSISACTTLLCSLVQSYPQLLMLRALLGLALGGMPAVAIAYLSEEVEPTALASTIGLYIAGSALGGMSGRLINALLCDFLAWQAAFAIMGGIGLYSAWEFWRNLPEAHHFKPHQRTEESALVSIIASFRRHLALRPLVTLFTLGFILTGCFTSFYNYISFRLVAAPFHFSQASLGAISIFFLLGMAGSIWVGSLVAHYGRYRLIQLALISMVLGLLLTLSSQIYLIVAGTALFTLSFFAAHSVASSSIAQLASAPKALASAIYLFCYYSGASVLGSVGGIFWTRFAWMGMVFFQTALLILAFTLISLLQPTQDPH